MLPRLSLLPGWSWALFAQSPVSLHTVAIRQEAGFLSAEPAWVSRQQSSLLALTLLPTGNGSSSAPAGNSSGAYGAKLSVPKPPGSARCNLGFSYLYTSDQAPFPASFPIAVQAVAVTPTAFLSAFTQSWTPGALNKAVSAGMWLSSWHDQTLNVTFRAVKRSLTIAGVVQRVA